MKRIAEEKRREKLEEKLARQKVLEQIERDKQARKEKFGMASSASSAIEVTSMKPPPQPVEIAQTQPKKDYDQCRLQVNLKIIKKGYLLKCINPIIKIFRLDFQMVRL